MKDGWNPADITVPKTIYFAHGQYISDDFQFDSIDLLIRQDQLEPLSP